MKLEENGNFVQHQSSQSREINALIYSALTFLINTMSGILSTSFNRFSIDVIMFRLKIFLSKKEKIPTSITASIPSNKMMISWAKTHKFSVTLGSMKYFMFSNKSDSLHSEYVCHCSEINEYDS